MHDEAENQDRSVNTGRLPPDQTAEQKPPEREEDVFKSTTRMRSQDILAILSETRRPIDAQFTDDGEYLILPADEKKWSDVRWRIAVMGLPNEPEPIQLELRGDVVLGRGSEADIDLTPNNAEQLGVSRKHAMLRPTISSLFLLDLESTNGTQHNTMPLGPGSARRLAHNDAVSLGQLSFVIKVVSGPVDA